MNNLTKSKTSVLWYATSADQVDKVVVPAGNRVCLRSYGMYSLGDWLAAGMFTTKANFRTTSNSSTPLFSDLAPQMSFLVGYAQILCTVEIPGDGILFEDGLFIELQEVTSRTVNMQTLLQVVYS